LPNGLQAYFLANGQGQRLDAAPIEIVSDRHQPEDPVIRNGRSCMVCHYDGTRSFKDEVRPTLREFDEVRFNLKKAFALYPPQETLDRAMSQDRARFLKAAAEVGADAAQSPETEPIRALARRFESDLDLAHAAAETGLAPEPFEQRLRASSRLIAIGFGLLLTPGGAVKRDTWEQHFRELADRLDIGDVAPGGEEIAARGPSKSVKTRPSKHGSRDHTPAAVNVRDLFREPGWTAPERAGRRNER